MNKIFENHTEVTIDDLAVMINKGFKETDRKISILDERVSNIEDNMATKEDIRNLDNRIDGVESRMATKEDLKRFATKDDLNDLERRMVDTMATKEDFQNLEETIVKNHGHRLRRVEAKLQLA